MSSFAKGIIGVIVLVLVIWGLVYFGSRPGGDGDQTSLPPAGPIKIGLIAPLTGDAAVYGEPLSNVARLAVKEINNVGGVNNRQLELVIEDGKCNGKDGANAGQKLINVDKVRVILGGFCSSESLAVVPIAAQGKVFLFSPSSSSPDLTGINPFFARNYPSDATQGKVLADIAYTQKGWKEVAFLQEQLDYPLGIYKAFSTTFEALGGQVVKEEFPSATTDFRSPLTKLRAEKPDALFIDTQTPAVAERILKQLGELKWKVPLLVSDAVSGDPKTVTNNAAALEGTLAAEFGVDPQNSKFQALLANYKAQYGADVPYQSYAQTMYDAVYLVRDGLLAAGEDGEKLANWIRTVKDWLGASGKVTIGPDGDLVGGHVPKIIKGGKVELYTKQ